MLKYTAGKALVAMGVATEWVAWLQSQPVLGLIGFLGTVITGAWTWYHAEQGKRREMKRREGALDLICEANERAIREGKAAPYPDYLPPPDPKRRRRGRKAK